MPEKNTKALILARVERTNRLLADPEGTMKTIFEHVANKGSLIDLAETWDVSYSDVCTFIEQDPKRKEILKAANQHRKEWFEHAIIRELGRLAFVDIRELYNDDGTLKPMSEWPAGASASVMSIETDEIFEQVGREKVHVGNRKKLKLYNKLQSIELLGKCQGMFIQKLEVTGKMTYEQFMATTYDNPGEKK